MELNHRPWRYERPVLPLNYPAKYDRGLGRGEGIALDGCAATQPLHVADPPLHACGLSSCTSTEPSVLSRDVGGAFRSSCRRCYPRDRPISDFTELGNRSLGKFKKPSLFLCDLCHNLRRTEDLVAAVIDLGGRQQLTDRGQRGELHGMIPRVTEADRIPPPAAISKSSLRSPSTESVSRPPFPAGSRTPSPASRH